ncbi:helix-turn-helix domain-containing protein [Microbulbifer salipaludis]|uniref:Helix-turn-helix domain-containing protein n=1 Tax=Microbulbifer salipaludis TaxID=187980 RepID=A0ABS3E7E4_9GAMM|nr:helix-turn-helix domain-containing protein [Microbulbifer salipaludis]MBN8431225.1 helix-turn-helix domain-containing protein [Microbulbifer salipaludis]
MQDQQLLDEALVLMRNNLSEPLRTGELAAYLEISVKKLERIFCRFKGVLPARYYRELRLQRARTLLFESALSVEEVGLQCGFRSASHFSRAFRDTYGRSPRAERMLATRAEAAGYFCFRPTKSDYLRVELCV